MAHKAKAAYVTTTTTIFISQYKYYYSYTIFSSRTGCSNKVTKQTTSNYVDNVFNNTFSGTTRCVIQDTTSQASGDESSLSKTGHFTQVVWKESTVLGIGRAEIEQDGKRCAYIVGRYKSAGNMVGSIEENVPRGNFNSTYCATISS